MKTVLSLQAMAEGAQSCAAEQLLQHFLPLRIVPEVVRRCNAAAQQPTHAACHQWPSAEHRVLPSGLLDALSAHPLAPGAFSLQAGAAAGGTLPAGSSGNDEKQQLRPLTAPAAPMLDMQVQFKAALTRSACTLDNAHMMMLPVAVVVRLLSLALVGHRPRREDLLLLGMPLFMASLGPLLQHATRGRSLRMRPLLITLVRLCATHFAAVWAPALRGGLAGYQLLPLVAWALLNPLELRYHVPTQLLQLAIVLAGNVQPSASGGGGWVLPLPAEAAAQCLLGFLLPTLLVWVAEQKLRRHVAANWAATQQPQSQQNGCGCQAAAARASWLYAVWWQQ